MIGVWLVTVMVFFSCGGNETETEGKVQVSGKIENTPEGMVVLSQFTDSRPKVLDTLEVNASGEFSYELEVDTPTFYELNLYGQKTVRLALYKEDVELTYDFSDPASLAIEGSKDTKEMLKIEQLMEAYQADVNKLNEAYYEAMSKNDTEAIKKNSIGCNDPGIQSIPARERNDRQYGGFFCSFGSSWTIESQKRFSVHR